MMDIRIFSLGNSLVTCSMETINLTFPSLSGTLMSLFPEVPIQFNLDTVHFAGITTSGMRYEEVSYLKKKKKKKVSTRPGFQVSHSEIINAGLLLC